MMIVPASDDPRGAFAATNPQYGEGPLLRVVRDQRIAFLIVGVTNTALAVAWFVLFLALIEHRAGYMSVLMCTHVASVLCAFFLHRHLVFRVRGHLFRDLFRFELVNLTALGVNAALLPFCVEVLGWQVLYSQLVITAINMFLSFFGHRNFSFRRSATDLAKARARVVNPAPESVNTGAFACKAVSVATAALPTVSVVIPSYNSAGHIEATMHSILQQTYTDLEVIVSDHSSDDGTWELLQQFDADPRVRLQRLPPGGGAPANWNAVSREATGTFLKLVCGDDLIYPTCVAEQVDVMSRYPDVVLVASQRDVLDKAGNPVVKARGLQGLDGRVSGDAAVRRTVRAGTNVFGEPACVLVRRQALADSGWWDDRAPYLIDQATFARIALQGSVFALRRSLAGFRVSPEQWSVKLVRAQAEHAARFHHIMAVENPGLLSSGDVRMGDFRALIMSVVRRGAYLYLRVRSRLAGGERRPGRESSPAALG